MELEFHKTKCKNQENATFQRLFETEFRHFCCHLLEINRLILPNQKRGVETQQTEKKAQRSGAMQVWEIQKPAFFFHHVVSLE